MHDIMKTTYITPIVCYLCHENCEDNGSIIEVLGLLSPWQPNYYSPLCCRRLEAGHLKV